MSQPPPNLDYAGYDTSLRKPGLLTAMGIVSIVLAVIRILWGAVSIVQSVAIGAMSRVAVPGPTGTVTVQSGISSASVTLNQSTTVQPGGAAAGNNAWLPQAAGIEGGGPDGLELTPQQVAIVMEELNQVVTLTAEQQGQLEGMLEFFGRRVVPDIDEIQNAVVLSGRFRPGRSNSPGVIAIETDDVAMAESFVNARDRFANFPGVFANGPGGTAAVGPNGTTVTATAPPALFPFSNVSMPTLILNGIAGLIEVVLAVLLLIAGIATLRSKAAGQSLHRLWGILKIPVAVLGAVAAGMLQAEMMKSVMASMPIPNAPINMTWIGVVQGAFMLLFSLIYPITVLCLLRLKSFREFFDRVRVFRNAPEAKVA